MISQIDFKDTLFPPRKTLAKFVFPNAKYPLREIISISFSGGKTSAYMLAMILTAKRAGIITQPIHVTFCNTGLEHEETLKFVQRCDDHFKAGVVWLEAVVNYGERLSTSHKIVDFNTASRNGEPFRDVVQKYGISNQAYPHCNRELKLNVMESYRKSIGMTTGSYSTAIGIRADEVRRISWEGMTKQGLFYPCIDAGIGKPDVNAYWQTMPFNLNIPEHYGNCVGCWKKSDRKLFTIAKQDPNYFDFFLEMEKIHQFTGGEWRKAGGLQIKPRVFFRNNRSTLDIMAAAQKPFEPFVDGKFIPFDDEMDEGDSCNDSCEIN